MEKLAEDIRDLFSCATPQERRFFRRVPSLSSIEKEISNFEKFSEDGKIIGRRMGMGQVGMIDGHVAGYHSFVIMENARATLYERKNIDMGNDLNYVYSKKLFVHPDFRNQGIGGGFIQDVLSLSEKLGKHYIADVDINNYLMINLFSQHELQNDFTWKTPRDVEMVRFYRD